MILLIELLSIGLAGLFFLLLIASISPMLFTLFVIGLLL